MKLNMGPLAIIFVAVFLAWFFTGNARADQLYGSGTGSFVTSDGYVLTVSHVACIPNTKLTIVYNGKEYPASPVVCDLDNDIALLHADVTNTPSLAISSDPVQVGETLYTDGFPLPEMYNYNPIFASGIATGNIDAHFYGMDLSIAPGHSGSPVVNGYGEVVGTVNAVAIAEGSLMQGMDISSRITNLLSDIKKQGLKVNLQTGSFWSILKANFNMHKYLEDRVVLVNIYQTSSNNNVFNQLLTSFNKSIGDK